ncbi:MAG: nucleoside monophosphate kinase [Planctomycetota bacterium]|nr:MAG: nucleoside monophosphate kinase [Planctomycetota bacterium]REJ93474.1 MAG: nucleoside monophosphate kinase [Planctomycetota bacterium]REK23213.1 MAG: nucleoside monophosphate kinase [Planctomycetota bacterium]REK30868.1 MAG: nucleoside monophosphate kinase [Planctomycetota bacterium]
MQQAPYPYPAALIFGVPGAGKGTQGDILRHVPGFFHVSSGVVFRKLDPQSPDGRSAREYISRGELVPDDMTIRLFSDHLEAERTSGRFDPANDLLLLDGIPRNLTQQELLKQYVDVRLVLHLVCRDKEAMIERIKRRARIENRDDDASEAITRKRFEIYDRETVPVLAGYPDSIIRGIESSMTQAEVLLECLEALVPVFKECMPRDLAAAT